MILASNKYSLPYVHFFWHFCKFVILSSTFIVYRNNRRTSKNISNFLDLYVMLSKQIATLTASFSCFCLHFNSRFWLIEHWRKYSPNQISISIWLYTVSGREGSPRSSFHGSKNKGGSQRRLDLGEKSLKPLFNRWLHPTYWRGITGFTKKLNRFVWNNFKTSILSSYALSETRVQVGNALRRHQLPAGRHADHQESLGMSNYAVDRSLQSKHRSRCRHVWTSAGSIGISR